MQHLRRSEQHLSSVEVIFNGRSAFDVKATQYRSRHSTRERKRGLDNFVVGYPAHVRGVSFLQSLFGLFTKPFVMVARRFTRTMISIKSAPLHTLAFKSASVTISIIGSSCDPSKPIRS